MGQGLPGAKAFAPPSGVGSSQGSNVVTPAAPAQPASAQMTVPALKAMPIPANPYADLLKARGAMMSRQR